MRKTDCVLRRIVIVHLASRSRAFAESNLRGGLLSGTFCYHCPHCSKLLLTTVQPSCLNGLSRLWSSTGVLGSVKFFSHYFARSPSDVCPLALGTVLFMTQLAPLNFPSKTITTKQQLFTQLLFFTLPSLISPPIIH